MQKNLVIVESPAKAKTIGNFLGSDYKVLSSYGHIRDLKKNNLGIDINNQFQPEYIVPDDKKKVVEDLKKAAKDATTVWLASDEDREGEAIAWHLYEVLGLANVNTKRIVFHEITKTAIQEAIKNPREIDINLVDAQQARRVLDRIVGFELSPVLWKRIKPSLSAGRVQSVAVRLIVEREREIDAFQVESGYRVVAIFKTPQGEDLKAELTSKLDNKAAAEALLKRCIDGQFKVSAVEKKPGKRSPAPPFTTSTLQQEASRKLGYSVSQTMRIAQTLYEQGHITYMRTDSVNLSSLAMNTIKSVVVNTWGNEYHQPRNYKTKSKGAQEAHEAIRPTYIDREEIQGTAQQKKLYDLIRKRTLASQMADAKLERTIINIDNSTAKVTFEAQGEVVLFPGFLGVYFESSEEDENGFALPDTQLLPKVVNGETMLLQKATATERFSQRPARYSEASLVRKMEELGIGRPSTYAPTIQTIQNREYVERADRPAEKRKYKELTLKNGNIEVKQLTESYGAERGKLFPTDIGVVVNDFLVQSFPDIVNYNFTADVEEQFDKVALGKLDWHKLMDSFYQGFHPMVKDASEINSNQRVGERILGEDPASGKVVSVRIGRYGPMAQIGTSEDGEKPRFAKLLPEQSISSISLSEALALFALPKSLGDFQGHEVVVSSGRFGPYVKYQNKFVSIPKQMDPMSVSLDEAIALINEKVEAEQKGLLKSFEEKPDLEVRNGRFGAYLKYDGNNYKLPKTVTDPTSLTLQECLEIIEKAPEPRASKTRKTTAKTTKKSPAKKAAKKTKASK